MSQIEKLHQRLALMQVTNFNIFPGTKPVSGEQLAEEINKALDAIEAGDYEEIF